MMLRTDLDHLPHAMRQEIRRVAALLFEGFDSMIAGRFAERYRSGYIVKLILYGDHASPDWSLVPPASPIRLLAIVSHTRLAGRRDDWTAVRDRLRRAWEFAEIAHPVRLSVHGLRAVNHALVQGVPYFVSIATQGIALHEADGTRLATPHCLSNVRRYERGLAEFVRWYKRAGDFLMGAAFYEARGNAAMTALLLHQACEHLYHCVSWSLTLHGPRTHALDELREAAEELDTRLTAAWPRATPFERQAFGCIRRAYLEVRYGQHYRISDEEQAWAMQRVTILHKAVEAVCSERLDLLTPSLHGAAGERGRDHVL